jgi:hypothetical protein
MAVLHDQGMTTLFIIHKLYYCYGAFKKRKMPGDARGEH